MLDTRNMPKRTALFKEINELEGSKRPYQKIVDDYNIGRRFFPARYAKGTDAWDIASDARAEIRAIEKKIQAKVKVMANTFE